MAIPEPQKSSENKYLGNRMLVILEDQRSHTRKALITKIIWKQNNYETRWRTIKYMSGTIAEKPKNAYPNIVMVILA
jgi:hypothetical protein